MTVHKHISEKIGGDLSYIRSLFFPKNKALESYKRASVTACGSSVGMYANPGYLESQIFVP